MWTDEVLADREAAMRRPHLLPPGQPWGHDLVVAQATRDVWADLYRLARLGLAAEQTGHRRLAACVNGDTSPEDDVAFLGLLNHPAWRTE